MKRINLSIPTPCHESWDQMTQAEKGKFCASCQKTVVDFTNMSDRQLAEFFKKPGTATCGRFYEDQLNRDIAIPGKRIPWVNYFFRFTWPAFVFFLKSCGVKNDATGKIMMESKATEMEKPYSLMVLGESMPKVLAKGTPKNTGSAPEMERPRVIGDTVYRDGSRVVADERPKTSYVLPPADSLDSTGDSIAIKTLPRPIPVLPACNLIESRLGGLVVVGYSVRQKKQRPLPLIKRIVDTAFRKFSVYPNPVQRNSNLKIDLKKLDPGQYTLSVISMSGQVVQRREVMVGNKDRVVDLLLGETPAGTYIVQVFNRKTAASHSEKIMVE